MRIKVLISLEGAESYTECAFYEGVRNCLPRNRLSLVYPSNISNKPENDCARFQEAIEQAKQAAYNSASAKPKEIFADIFFMWDEDNAIMEYYKNVIGLIKIEKGDTIKDPLVVEGGFEMGVLNKLLECPKSSIKELTIEFGYKAKKNFKREFNKNFHIILNRIEGVLNTNDEIIISEWIYTTLKKRHCPHYILFSNNN